jgi:predicted GNAT family acetyltransferase
MNVPNPKQGFRSRFEIDEEGQTAYLEFEVDESGWMTIWHTEVPEALRGRGIANMLARTALDYARDRNLKVDVICPSTADFIRKNPEYKPLVGR